MPVETATKEPERALQDNKEPDEEAKTSQELEKQPEKDKQEPSTSNLKGKAPQQPKTWPHTITQTREASTAIWVPKKLAQAQKGSRQMWVPRRVPQDPPRRNQPTQRPQKKVPRRVATKHSNNTLHKVNYCQQIWLPKTLLKAQKDSQYKWIPKHLLKAIPTQQQLPQTKKPPHKPQELAKTTGQTRWVAKKTLSNQGYYKGATHIWLPKQANTRERQNTGRLRPTPTSQAPKLQKKIWVKKAEDKQQTERQVAPIMPPCTQKRATAQEKGKWVPKEAEMVTHDYIKELPSTSQQSSQVPTIESVKEQGPNKPSTLDVAQHLAFILKAFSSQKVKEVLGVLSST